MNFVAAIIGLVVPLPLGLLLLGYTCAAPPFRNAAGNLALAHMVGTGALTLLLLITQIVTGRLLVFPVYVFLILLLLGWSRIAKRIRHLVTNIRPQADRAEDQAQPVVRRLLLASIAVCAIVTVLAGFKSGLGWDAWTFWQLKARAFFINGDMSFLKDPMHCFHPDYPPMIPLLSYWVFAHGHTTAEVWPEIIGMIFYFDLLLVSYAAFRLWLGETPSLGCVLLIASARVVQKYALAGYADVAAAAYMLAVAVFLLRRFVDRDSSAGVPLMWMLALTCLVKNESLAWTIGAIAVVASYSIVQRSRSAVWYGLSFAAGYLPWFWLQRAWNLKNLVTSKPVGNIPASAALASLADIVTHFAKYALTIGPQYPAWGLCTILVIAGFVMAIRRRDRHVVPLVLMLSLQFASYIVILIWAIWIEPGWYGIYINDTLHRCLLQVFPAAMLLAGLGCFMPRETTPSASDSSDALPIAT